MKEERYEKVRKIDNEIGFISAKGMFLFGLGMIFGNIGCWDIFGNIGVLLVIGGLFFMWLSTKVYWRKVK